MTFYILSTLLILFKKLNKALAEPRYCSWFLLSQPLTKLRKEPYTAIYFIFLMILSYWLLMIFIYPVMNNIEWILITNFIYLNVIIFWWISTFRDPGYLRKSNKIDFITLVERYEPGCLWPKCHVIRTPRSRHCNICDKWVERFDHHCPWINNWIGTRNHGAFLIFLIVTYLLLSVLIIQLVLNFTAVEEEVLPTDIPYIDFIISEEIVRSELVYKTISLIMIIISSFFWILMNLLLYTQIMSFMLNQTMNERYGAKSKKNKELNSSNDKSIEAEDDRAILIQNVSIDSTLACKNNSKWSNFCLMMKGSQSKDQYKLFIESMKRIGTSTFESILNNKKFY